MTNSPKEARRRRSAMRLWTFEQAQAALPYIASILRSVREHMLEVQAQQRLLKKFEQRPGRPDRTTLIDQDEARRAQDRAKDELRKSAGELTDLDVVLQDPLQGTALVPFLYDEQLAWFIYDLHDEKGLRFWRYHSDSEETRRRLTSAQTR